MTGPDRSDGPEDGPEFGSDDGSDDGTGDRSADQVAARRWRLLLGAPAQEPLGVALSREETAMDAALAGLYDGDGESRPSSGRRRSAGLGASAPSVARWLGDIRTYFPSSVVQVMQRDALERLQLHRMLLEPELLESLQPDVHLVGALVGLSRVMPERTRATARAVVQQVVRQVEERVGRRTRSAVAGSIDRGRRTRRPRPHDIDWDRTITANLRNYLPEQRTVVPARLVGYRRSTRSVARDVVVAVDQSASMAESVVYAAVFGSVLAGLAALRTRLVAFDTAVVDLTERLADPVEVLFGCQLGGGTDIAGALAYCAGLVTRPAETLLVLVSDLFDGGTPGELVTRLARLQADGVTVLVLLALSDAGAPAFDHEHAAALAALGIPAFACTPDLFPDLLAVALGGGDVERWVAGTRLAAAAVLGGPGGPPAESVGKWTESDQ